MGVKDSSVAFLLKTLLNKIPITPVVIASTKHFLNPISLTINITKVHLNIRSQSNYAHASKQKMIKVSE